MAIIELIKCVILKFFNDLRSKTVNDSVDILKDAVKNRKSEDQNIQTQEFQVIIDSLKQFTYKEENELSDVAEIVLKGLKSGKNSKEAIREGLREIFPQVTDDMCAEFLEIINHEMCKNDNLYKEKTYSCLDEEIKGNNRRHKATHEKLQYIEDGINNLQEGIDNLHNNVDKIPEMIGTLEKDKTEYFSEIPIENRADEYAQKWDKNVFLNDFNLKSRPDYTLV